MSVAEQKTERVCDEISSTEQDCEEEPSLTSDPHDETLRTWTDQDHSQMLRNVCVSAGGELYAERIIPLLKTNLLTLKDIDPNSAHSITRLRRAGLSDVEVRMLALQLLSMSITQSLSMDDSLKNWYMSLRPEKGTSLRVDNCGAITSAEEGFAVFNGSLNLPSEVAAVILAVLPLRCLGTVGAVSKAWARCLQGANRGPDSPFRRHATMIAISQALVPSSWMEIMRQGTALNRALIKATSDLLQPVVNQGTLSVFGNGLEFTLPVCRDAAHDYCLDRWSIGYPETNTVGARDGIPPSRQLAAGISIWSVALPFFRSEDNDFGDPLARALESAFMSIKGWSREVRRVSPFTVLPAVASGSIGPFYNSSNPHGGQEGGAGGDERPQYMERTMGVLEGCRMEREEAEQHLITITGGEGIPGIPPGREWHAPDNASQFRCPVAINSVTARHRFARKVMSLVEGQNPGPVTWHSNLYQGQRSRVHLRGVAPWTWESPFTPAQPPHLTATPNAFLHYLDTGLVAVGEQHLVVFWVRVPARHGYLLGLA